MGYFSPFGSSFTYIRISGYKYFDHFEFVQTASVMGGVLCIILRAPQSLVMYMVGSFIQSLCSFCYSVDSSLRYLVFSKGGSNKKNIRVISIFPSPYYYYYYYHCRNHFIYPHVSNCLP